MSFYNKEKESVWSNATVSVPLITIVICLFKLWTKQDFGQIAESHSIYVKSSICLCYSSFRFHFFDIHSAQIHYSEILLKAVLEAFMNLHPRSYVFDVLLYHHSDSWATNRIYPTYCEILNIWNVSWSINAPILGNTRKSNSMFGIIQSILKRNSTIFRSRASNISGEISTAVTRFILICISKRTDPHYLLISMRDANPVINNISRYSKMPEWRLFWLASPQNY